MYRRPMRLEQRGQVEDQDTRRDEDLLVASRREPGLFVGIYRRKMHSLLAYFVRRTLDAQLAADLTAETMAEAFASRRRFRDRGPGSATAWIYAIAAGKLSHYTRRLQVEDAARRRLGMPRIELGFDDIERIEALIDFEKIRGEVRTAFGRLQSKQREALRLCASSKGVRIRKWPRCWTAARKRRGHELVVDFDISQRS